MKKLIFLMIVLPSGVFAQVITGSWQLTNESSCLTSEITGNQSDTEKELLADMKGSATRVARVVRFNKNGKGEDGVFTAGRKRGDDRRSFNYLLEGNKLVLLDTKSGIMLQSWVVDELTASTLKVHNAERDCEVKTFTRIK